MRRHSLAICLVALVAATACGSFGIRNTETGDPNAPPPNVGNNTSGGTGTSQDPTEPTQPSPRGELGFCAKHTTVDTEFCADFESGNFDDAELRVETNGLPADTSIVQVPGRSGRVLRVEVPYRLVQKDKGSFLLLHDLDMTMHGVVYDASFAFYVGRNGFESAGLGMFRYLGLGFELQTGIASFEEGKQLNSLFKEGSAIVESPSRWRTAHIRVAAGEKYAKSTIEIDNVPVLEQMSSSFELAGLCDFALGVFFTSTPNHPGAAEVYFDDVLVRITNQ